jgi:hypothetical protein
MALFTMTSTTVESDRRLRFCHCGAERQLGTTTALRGLSNGAQDPPLFCTTIVGAAEMAKSVTKGQETKKLLE